MRLIVPIILVILVLLILSCADDFNRWVLTWNG